ncbi:MAG: YdgA family protein [Burkholderiales bacterium]|jgi:uncharacterized protein YdgA (DUF945 family)|nr:YdgA family protein [Burkholderiales bacterium]
MVTYKKAIVGIGVFLIFVALFLGATWKSGNRAQTLFDGYYAQAKTDVPYIEIVSHDYQRGFWASTDTATLRLAPGYFGDALPKDVIDQFEVVLKSKVHHGPFLGAHGFGAAFIQSEAKFADQENEKLLQVFGDKPPSITQSTKVGFDGSSRSQYESAAARYSDDVFSVSWEGFRGTSEATPNANQVTYRFSVPTLEFQASEPKEGTFTLRFSDVAVAGDAKKIFKTAPSAYLSSGTVTIDKTFIVDEEFALRLDQLSYALETPVENQFLSILGTLNVKNIVSEKNTSPSDQPTGSALANRMLPISNLSVAWSIKPLNIAVVEEVVGLYNEFMSSSDRLAESDVKDTVIKTMEKFLPDHPTVSLNRFSVELPDGKVEADASATLADEAGASFELGVTGNLLMPPKVAQLFPPVMPLVMNGYFKQEEDKLLTAFEYKNGTLRLNGKELK